MSKCRRCRKEYKKHTFPVFRDLCRECDMEHLNEKLVMMGLKKEDDGE